MNTQGIRILEQPCKSLVQNYRICHLRETQFKEGTGLFKDLETDDG